MSAPEKTPRPRKTAPGRRNYILHVRDSARTLCGRVSAKVNCFARPPSRITEEACQACARAMIAAGMVEPGGGAS